MRSIVLVVFLLPLLSFGSLVWGPKGHRVTGYIAEKHLTGKAKKALNDLLEGHSLAFVSNYADEIKSDTKYAGYTPWHYVNYPLDRTYKDSEKSGAGDIVTGIAKCKTVLRDGKSSRADKIFHLKLLIHFLGDLHQPLHVGRAGDRGGNDIPLHWFNERSNLHKLWDTNLLETYGMGFYELGDELDRSTLKKERKQIQEGTIESWLEESHVLAKQLYTSTNAGEKVGYSYAYIYNPMVFAQLKKEGFRLAKVLNEVFL